MSLDPYVFSDSIETDAKLFLSLDDNYKPLYDENKKVKNSYGNYIELFSSAYENYSLTGTVLGAEHGSQQKSFLEVFLGLYSNNIVDFATALANYWSTVLLVNGTPMHGGVSVISVTNDAILHIPEFIQAIESSYTTDLYNPMFHNLINNIEHIALPSITWVVTELVWVGNAFVPVPFNEKIV